MYMVTDYENEKNYIIENINYAWVLIGCILYIIIVIKYNE
jgi:hypothetical protein